MVLPALIVLPMVWQLLLYLRPAWLMLLLLMMLMMPQLIGVQRSQHQRLV
jgi:hypothetical protein